MSNGPPRRPLYWLGGVLLLAGILPRLDLLPNQNTETTFFAPPLAAAALPPVAAKAVTVYPVVAGFLVLLLAALARPVIRGPILVLLGAVGPWLLVREVGLPLASAGVFVVDTLADGAMFVGGACLFVGTYVVSQRRGALWLAGLAALGGVLLLLWLFVPRPPSAYETWLGFDRVETPTDVPLGRAGAAVRAMPDGTPLRWYFWTGAFLLAVTLSAVLGAILPLRRRAARPGRAGFTLSVFVSALIALIIVPIATGLFEADLAIGQKRMGGVKDGWERTLRVLNGCRLVLPPMLLALIALVGVSESLLAVVPADDEPLTT